VTKRSATFREERLQLAWEMSRVLNRGGKMVVSSSNRRFPVDLFHGRAPGCYRPQIHRSGSRFLLSIADYRELFSEAGYSTVRALPVEGY
jgi:hypothetical protein